MGRLAALHADQTERLIVDSAVRLLEQSSMTGLTVRDVAKTAGMSERTVFRYFATRDEFLDAIAREVMKSLHYPALPRSVEELLAMPRGLYAGFEARPNLVKAALHSELFDRIRPSVTEERSKAIRKIVNELAPRAREQDRKLAVANIRFYLTATTWHYYRFYFAFTPEETALCAERAIGREIALVRQQNGLKKLA